MKYVEVKPTDADVISFNDFNIARGKAMFNKGQPEPPCPSVADTVGLAIWTGWHKARIAKNVSDEKRNQALEEYDPLCDDGDLLEYYDEEDE